MLMENFGATNKEYYGILILANKAAIRQSFLGKKFC